MEETIKRAIWKVKKKALQPKEKQCSYVLQRLHPTEKGGPGLGSGGSQLSIQGNPDRIILTPLWIGMQEQGWCIGYYTNNNWR